MEDRLKILINYLGDIRVKTDIDVSDQLGSRQGGMVKAFYIATTTRELEKAIECCRELKLNYLIIGSGSKTLFPKKVFTGVVIKNRTSNLKIFGIKGKVSTSGIGIEEALIEADSGVSLERLAGFVKSQGLKGFEEFSAYPGTIGGTWYSHQDLRERTEKVKVLNVHGDIQSKDSADVARDDILLSVIFRLKSGKS